VAANGTKTKNTAKTIKGLLTPQIGLSDDARQQSITLLNKRLSDAYVLYTKTRNYHWNVTGMQFIELHKLFEDQYDALAENIDAIAERVRKLGGIAFGTLDEFKQNSAIEEQPGVVPSAEGMIRNLLHDHETVIQQLRKDIDKTDEINDMTTNDFLIGLAEDHEKIAWMLRAHLETVGK